MGQMLHIKSEVRRPRGTPAHHSSCSHTSLESRLLTPLGESFLPGLFYFKKISSSTSDVQISLPIVFFCFSALFIVPFAIKKV